MHPQHQESREFFHNPVNQDQGNVSSDANDANGDLSLEEMIRQRDELESRINAIRQRDRRAAIEQVREAVRQWDLSPHDIFGAERRAVSGASAPRITVAPKYRNPETGATWTGRGKPPLWIADKNRGDYLIA